MLTNLLWLAWLLPAFPLLAFVLILFIASKRPTLSTVFAISGISLTLITAIALFIGYAAQPDVYQGSAIDWFTLGGQVTQSGIYIDGISAIMTLVVPIVCLMIFIYSVGYMHGDSRYGLFFAYISLFSAGMMGLVVFDNLLALFLCWEVMGTCSYLLIGFWYEKEVAYKAGLKAFLVTKAGDIFLTLGIVLLAANIGSLQYDHLLAPETLAKLAETPFIGNIPLATMAGILIFIGAMGKSAQFPLHVWLPDAMAGPTPASSLIHAATMVSAGVFLLIRTFPLLEIGHVLPFVAFIGAFTALFAAIIGLTQNDIKRVLAFSTISQLGYMVTAVGIGARDAALFHLVTHAIFKALLFMAAGSVIHGMEHGHQHSGALGHDGEFDPNELFSMGGLAKRMPKTALSFTAGAMALSGFPLISSGFWSKDEIIAASWEGHQLVFWVLVLAAGLTALYTGRELILAFLGKPRSMAAQYASESSKWMTIPNFILGGMALIAGWFGIPGHFPVLGGVVPNVVQNLIHPVLGNHSLETLSHESSSLAPLLLSICMALGGLFFAWLIYGRGRENRTDVIYDQARKWRLRNIYAFVQNMFQIDAFYDIVVVRPWVGSPYVINRFDTKANDGIVSNAKDIVTGVTNTTTWTDEKVIDKPVNAMKFGGLSQVSDWFDSHVINPPADIFAALTRALSALLHLADNTFVDGFVSTVASSMRSAGRYVKDRQTGVLTDYLWDALVMVLILIAGILLLQQ